MFAKLTVSLLVLAAFAAVAPAASADPFGAGDCSKAGLCAGGCVEVRADCAGGLVCVGASYQVPQCVDAPAELAAPPEADCTGLPCDVVNAACLLVLGARCLG